MDWGGGSRWRKAWIISFVLHSIVLISAGWMVGKALLPTELPEALLELELTNEPASPPGAGAALPEQRPANNAAPEQPVQQQVRQTTTAVEEAVVAVSSMAVESIDTSAIVAASAAASGGGAATGGSGAGEGSGAGSGSGGGYGAGRDIIPPGILSRREPAYPEQARRNGVEGTVVLRIEILENGHAGNISVYRSSGSEQLDEAAVDAVQRWRFVPAKVRRTGQSIACQTTMPVVFRLRA